MPILCGGNSRRGDCLPILRRDLQAPSKPAQQIKKPLAKKQISILSVVGLLILICCGLSLVRAMATNYPRVTPTPKTLAAGANSVVIITYTPAVSNTPKPTKTPIATRTSQPTADAYILLAQQKFSEFRDAYLDVYKYTQQVAKDTTLVFDEDWKTKTGLALGILNFRADEMAKLEPSPDYEKFHSCIVEIAKETHLFTESYATGIDNLDTKSIDTATEHLTNLTTLMQNATLELESINSNP